MSSVALPYHEPSIVDILILSSFLLLLNTVNSVIDNYLYCGLVGQIFVGIVWGTPGAAWLSLQAQETITQIGYVGLILLVFEGGVSTSFSALKTNLLLSTAVALVGILLPMALSFSLIGMAHATPLQAFAAGAALCSTSLGTTFTLLSSSGLVESPLGVVLSSAAILDDVVGLVMVQIISNLGTSSLSAVTIVRPVFVSIAFVTLLPILCVFIVKPIMRSNFRHQQRRIPKWIKVAATGTKSAFVIHTLLLIAFVTGASYAGTSNLLSAYLAGATISWWDSDVYTSRDPHEKDLTQSVPPARPLTDRRDSRVSSPDLEPPRTSTHEQTDDVIARGEDQKDRTPKAAEVYAQFFETAVRRVLKPFFFASIGFSIPISKMFSGFVLWRGILYSALMMLGKLACGVWILPFRALMQPHSNISPAPTGPGTVSFYPSSILGFAMVARGEIGFLISSIAESKGVYRANDEPDSGTVSKLFLIVSWAIVLCTIIGPLCVGVFIRIIQQKVAQRLEGQVERADRWGIWRAKPI